VIIAKVERGSKASVAGLKPMEIIRTVNEQPVKNAKDFQAAIKAGGEYKLAVKRMTQGRTVKVKCDPEGTGKSDTKDAAPGRPPGAPGGKDLDGDEPAGKP